MAAIRHHSLFIGNILKHFEMPQQIVLAVRHHAPFGRSGWCTLDEVMASNESATAGYGSGGIFSLSGRMVRVAAAVVSLVLRPNLKDLQSKPTKQRFQDSCRHRWQTCDG